MNLDIFRNISYKTRTACEVCQKKIGEPVIKLSSLPITEIYTKEYTGEKSGLVDQNLYACKECGHAQLSHIIDPEVLYGNTYSFRTSKSMSVKGNDAFINFIYRATQNKKFNTIMEIGCNDLYLLNSLADKADNFIGIDPILKGREKELSTDKIKVLGDFFENLDPEEYKSSGNTLVLSSHVLEHIESPKKMIKNLVENSNDNTLFIFQFPGFDTLVDNYRFDQIYHHHLHYFSLHSFTYLLNELSCELIDHDINHHYWGSLMVAFRKMTEKNINPLPRKITSERIQKNYELFRNTMKNTNEYLKALKGEKVYGYGAGLQLPILSYHLHNDFSFLESIIDDNKDKDGLYYPNLPVTIKHSSRINSLEDSIVVVTGVNFARDISRRLIELNPKIIVLLMSIM